MAARNVPRETSPEEELARIRDLLQRLHLAWDEAIEERWWHYLRLFQQWSERTNLVSRRDRDQWVRRHVFPSLALLEVVGFPSACRIADVGSGAGFPGLPLALCRPDCQFFLIEPRRWRALFLQEVREELGLRHVEVIVARAETPEVRERLGRRCHFVVARAVADLVRLWGWSSPLLLKGGELLAYKGLADAEAEAERLRVRAADLDVAFLSVPSLEGTVIVRVRRVGEEDAKPTAKTG